MSSLVASNLHSEQLSAGPCHGQGSCLLAGPQSHYPQSQNGLAPSRGGHVSLSLNSQRRFMLWQMRGFSVSMSVWSLFGLGIGITVADGKWSVRGCTLYKYAHMGSSSPQGGSSSPWSLLSILFTYMRSMRTPYEHICIIVWYIWWFLLTMSQSYGADVVWTTWE